MEQAYEKLLNIKTSGTQKNFNESIHYHRYEATSYAVLESLFKEYTLKNNDAVVDFGSGKGRLNFYINHFFNVPVTGIEMNNFLYQESLNNKKLYLIKHKNSEDCINFVNCFAEEYKIKSTENKFYFFNPFSLQIFTKIIDNILLSVENNIRPVDIILYYPSEDYIYYLENNTAFQLYKEINIITNNTDTRQKILIYNLPYLIY